MARRVEGDTTTTTICFGEGGSQNFDVEVTNVKALEDISFRKSNVAIVSFSCFCDIYSFS